jgi:hypothetical protein
MPSKALWCSAGLAAAVLLVATRPVSALSLPARTPLPASAAGADCIVVGKVTSVEEKPISAPPFPGATTKIEYHVAILKIDQALRGAEGLTQVRIAFQTPPPAPKPVPNPGGRPVAVSPRPIGIPIKPLTVDNEGCFLLTKNADEEFFRFVDRSYQDFIAKNDADFDKKLSLVKRSLKFLEAPMDGLKSKNETDRLLASYLVLYRCSLGAGRPNAKSEAIPAAESKLILETIAKADWTQNQVPADGFTPNQLFGMLRLTAKDGWTPPMQGPMQDYRVFMKQWETAAKKWLTDNGEKFQIQRWVAEKPAK